MESTGLKEAAEKCLAKTKSVLQRLKPGREESTFGTAEAAQAQQHNRSRPSKGALICGYFVLLKKR